MEFFFTWPVSRKFWFGQVSHFLVYIVIIINKVIFFSIMSCWLYIITHLCTSILVLNKLIVIIEIIYLFEKKKICITCTYQNNKHEILILVSNNLIVLIYAIWNLKLLCTYRKKLINGYEILILVLNNIILII